MLRSFVISTESKNLLLSNRPLRAASSSTTSAIIPYDPVNNAWAKKIADVVVGKVIILGLATKPSCIKLKGSSTGLEFEWKSGVAATGSRKSGGNGKSSSELTIKDVSASIVQDWDLVIEFSTSPCATTPAVDHELAFQPSAECPTGGLLCRNKGHLSSCILRSRVNDGICDPECCDGTDETDGKVSCANVCASVGAAYRKATEEEGRKSRVGAAIRRDYITFGAKEKTRMEFEVVRLSKEVAELEVKEKRLKIALEAVENVEASEIERKKESQLYERIIEMQAALKSLREQRAALETNVDDLSGILGDLSVRSSTRSSLASGGI